MKTKRPLEIVPWEAIDAYRGIIPAELRDPSNDIRRSAVCLAVSELWNPIGAAIGVRDAEDDAGHVLWLYVRPEHRRQGVATTLLEGLEAELAERGCRSLVLGYPRSGETALDAWLAAEGWDTERSYVVAVGNADGLQSRWLRRTGLPPWLTAFPWSDLTDADRDWIERRRQNGGFPEALDPFLREDWIDAPTSFGLRFADEVVGWIVNHRIDDRRLRVARFFVSREPLVRGHGLALLAQSMHLAIERAPDTLIEFRVHPENRSMLAFLRRLRPHLLEHYDHINATKEIRVGR